MKIGSLIRLKPDSDLYGVYGNNDEVLLIVKRNINGDSFDCMSIGKYPRWCIYDTVIGQFEVLIEGTL